MKYWTIIPAAGIGVRIQADRPKQYLMLNNEPILSRVINLFSSLPEIEKVVVVLNSQDHWWSTLSLSHPEKVLTAIGGQERVHSVLLGLQFLQDFADKNDFVLVHDAARPCVQVKQIQRLIAELHDHAVGGLFGLPVVDTLKKVDDDNNVLATVSRHQLWQAQTPQLFRYGLLKNAIEQSLLKNKIVTDESSAVEQFGLTPKMILGDVRNLKITYVEDLKNAAVYFIS